jgi:hypothetical protein
MSQVSPGWYPDPSGRFAQRYHDGSRWTEHVADAAGNRDIDVPGHRAGPASPAGSARGYDRPGTRPRQPGYGEQPGYGQRPAGGEGQAGGQRPAGGRPGYGRQPGYGQRPAGGQGSAGGRPGYGRRPGDGGPGYGERPEDGRAGYGERPGGGGQGGGKPGYGERPGYSERPGYGQDGAGPGTGDRRPGYDARPRNRQPGYGERPDHGQEERGGPRAGHRRPEHDEQPGDRSHGYGPQRDDPQAGFGPGSDDGAFAAAGSTLGFTPTIGLIVAGVGALFVLASVFVLDFLELSVPGFGSQSLSLREIADNFGDGAPRALDTYANLGRYFGFLVIVFAIVALLEVVPRLADVPGLRVIAAAGCGAAAVWHLLAMLASAPDADLSPTSGAVLGLLGYVAVGAGQFLTQPVAAQR